MMMKMKKMQGELGYVLGGVGNNEEDVGRAGVRTGRSWGRCMGSWCTYWEELGTMRKMQGELGYILGGVVDDGEEDFVVVKC